MPSQEPSAAVTMLFSDIEGSTQLLSQLGDAAYAAVLADHHAVVRRSLADHRGREVNTEGDAFFAAFDSPLDAVAAAVALQRGLANSAEGQQHAVRVRVGLHTGTPMPVAGDYVGLDVHRAARICSAAHGGQIVMSEPTALLAEQQLPDGTHLHDLGVHRLKGLAQPEKLSQVTIAGLPDAFPPLRSESVLAAALPEFWPPLVGREAAVLELVELIQHAAERVVTLIGPGGTGKTRLAVDVAGNLVPEFRDGAAFVDLAPVFDTDLVAATLARALGLGSHEQVGVPLIVDALRPQQRLIILDNFEHVLDAAPIVSEIVSACPGITFLVTSRAALTVRHERLYPVAPLSTVAAGDDLHEASCVSPAVQLFAEVAASTAPGFALTAENTPVIAKICRRLDGLPLAIELAARRSGALQPAELLTRLDQHFRLLRGGRRDAPERHRDLRSTIRWSYDLLNEEERRMFRSLGVFVGGATLDGVEFIWGEHADGSEAIERLLALTSQSLLRADRLRSGTRYVMLETIRAFANEALNEAGEALAVHRHHLAYYRSFAHRAQAAFLDGEAQESVERVDAELDNFRAALSWARQEPSAVADGLALATALEFYWFGHGRMREGADWVQEFLRAGAAEGSLRRARAFATAALLEANARSTATALPLAQQGVDLARSAGSEGVLAMNGPVLALLASWAGDRTRSADAATESEPLVRVKEAPLRHIGLGQLGESSMRRGENAHARTLLEEAIDICDQIDEEYFVVIDLWNLAQVTWAQGDHDSAWETGERSVRLAARSGSRELESGATGALGMIALAAGEIEEGSSWLVQSAKLAVDGGMRVQLPAVWSSLAYAQAERGHLDSAARLLGASERLAGALGLVLPPLQRDIRRAGEAIVERGLPEESRERERAIGQTLSSTELLREIDAVS